MAVPNPSVLLLYPPNQNLRGTICRPNGSLAYPSLAGTLRRHGTDVAIFDACVGNDRDDLNEVFFGSSTELPSGLLRTGVSDERILEEVAGYDIVGLTSIFTQQESMVLYTARLIHEHFPEKILISGGVNARSRLPQFFAAGFNVVCVSEAEDTITKIVDEVRRSRTPDFSAITGVATMHDGRIRVNPVGSTDIQWDLDSLAMPAWDLLPNKRYWAVGRPFGGDFEHLDEVRYGLLMTSIGCPFHCAYCHISGEQEGDVPGPIGKYRMKSDDRVLAELDVLKGLGMEQVFISDDSLLANKKRALRLLDKIRGSNLDILDVNGVNIIHLLKRWKPDHEVLQALVEAGFIDISLPFETGNLRIMRKYATNKLNIEQADIKALILACKDYGLRITGHYMVGYPDETLEELETTVNMARDHASYGLDACNFFLVMPLPGTTLYDMAIAGGHIDPDFDPDTMNWTKANMKNTVIPAAQLEELRDQAWLDTNPSYFKQYKREQWFAPKVQATAG